VFDIGGRASIIIRAAFLPPGKMIVFITMGVAAAICPRARPAELEMGTLHQPPTFGASSGSFLASKPGLFLASAEANSKGLCIIRRTDHSICRDSPVAAFALREDGSREIPHGRLGTLEPRTLRARALDKAALVEGPLRRAAE
jgi:hypothetical protein